MIPAGCLLPENCDWSIKIYAFWMGEKLTVEPISFTYQKLSKADVIAYSDLPVLNVW